MKLKHTKLLLTKLKSFYTHTSFYTLKYRQYNYDSRYKERQKLLNILNTERIALKEMALSNQVCKQHIRKNTEKVLKQHNLPPVIERIPTEIFVHPAHSWALYSAWRWRWPPAEHSIVTAASCKTGIPHAPNAAWWRSPQPNGRHGWQGFPTWGKWRWEKVPATSSDANFTTWCQPRIAPFKQIPRFFISSIVIAIVAVLYIIKEISVNRYKTGR